MTDAALELPSPRPIPENDFAPKTVVFLGAGASKAHGYPVGGKLLLKLAGEASRTQFPQFRQLWENWKTFVDQTYQKNDRLARLLLNPNPEIALTTIDLMAAALQWEDSAAEHEGFDLAAKDHKAGVKAIEQHYQSEARRELAEAITARSFLLQALDWFFMLRHAESRERGKASRDCLRAVFDDAGIQSGDAILTTNWDAIAELTLGEDGHWSPFDGYGFQRDLVNGNSLPDGKPAPFPPTLPKQSDIKVLKLHGSFGWCEANDELYLKYDGFLHELPFQFNSTALTFRDTLAPPSGYPCTSLFLHPSFLKRVRTEALQRVWHLASKAVRTAKRFVVVGYSLPEADAAIRTLLLPLRFRHSDGLVVEVIDPSSETLARWREFLGPNIQDRQIRVCEDTALG